ncbi:unnamed protein product [Adineta ricciae]|uniref:Uncharacterized protein n=1 Tax=Adineta ricciae TaxID=249248 RepID=A0A815IMW1_ADIRI|nr:unnamed protein product [Adineta ricciae]CAF1370942.1 unnamed protein product [Adineta ricciae]
MNYFYCLAFLIIYLGNFIGCQSQRTNIANQGLYSSISISCTDGNCRHHATIIAGSILGGGVGIIFLLIIFALCWKHCKGRPLKTNPKFIQSTNQRYSQDNSTDDTLFKSGIWSSRHIQDGLWYGFHRLTLTFDPQLCKVTGSGSDNNGVFLLDGVYSLATKRMGLVKTYQMELSKRSEDLKYQMLVQLVWNAKSSQFEGKWYIRTKSYSGENKFQLKFTSQQQSHPCKTV